MHKAYRYINKSDVLRGVAQFGRALVSGARGRRFKSHHPDQMLKKAQMAELVDALGSGPSEILFRGGSSPLLGTNHVFYFMPNKPPQSHYEHPFYGKKAHRDRPKD